MVFQKLQASNEWRKNKRNLLLLLESGGKKRFNCHHLIKGGNSLWFYGGNTGQNKQTLVCHHGVWLSLGTLHCENEQIQVCWTGSHTELSSESGFYILTGARHQIAGLTSVVFPCLVDIFPFINESVLCLLGKNKSQCYFDKSGHIKPALMTCFKESLVNSFAKLKHLSGPQMLLGPLTTGREFWKGRIIAHGDHNGLVSYLAHLSYKTYRREYIEQNISCRFSQQSTCIRKNTPWKKFLEHLKY